MVYLSTKRIALVPGKQKLAAQLADVTVDTKTPALVPTEGRNQAKPLTHSSYPFGCASQSQVIYRKQRRRDGAPD